VGLDELITGAGGEVGVDAEGADAELTPEWLVEAAGDRDRIGLRDPRHAGRVLLLHVDLLRKVEAATGCENRSGSGGTVH
jgi:hypothetical protein